MLRQRRYVTLVAFGLEGRATVGTVSIRSRQTIVVEKEIVIESEAAREE